jgi:hypothetical protein
MATASTADGSSPRLATDQVKRSADSDHSTLREPGSGARTSSRAASSRIGGTLPVRRRGDAQARRRNASNGTAAASRASGSHGAARVPVAGSDSSRTSGLDGSAGAGAGAGVGAADDAVTQIGAVTTS